MAVEFNIHQFPWQFLESPPLDVFCFFCKKILKDPMLTECCGAHYCKQCLALSTFSKKLAKCLNCDEKSVTCILDKSTWKKILQLKVYCPFRKMGCKWTGLIENCHTHLAGNCNSYSSQNLKSALKKFDTDTKKFETHNFNREDLDIGHSQPTRTRYCQNGCDKAIPESKQASHDEVCLEFYVSCEYKYVGCHVYFKRKHMIKHMKKNLLQHFHLHSKYVSNQIEKGKRGWNENINESKKMIQESLTATDIVKQSLSLPIRNVAQIMQIHRNQERTARAIFSRKPCMIWELIRETISLDAKIGSGQFSETWKGTQSGEHHVAIKRHKLGTTTKSNFLQESFTLNKLEHDNILRLVGISTNEEPALMVTEYMSNGNLLHYLSNEGKALTQAKKLKIIYQVANGMVYLESLNCVHRAINSRSVLIGDSFQCKIGSFTLAKILDKDVQEYTIPQGERIPIKWSAPEVLTDNKCSTKSDVWSFGILQYEIITREPLKMANARAESFITSGEKLDPPPNCPQNVYEIMLLCWETSPDSRPSFESLKGLLENLN